MLAMCSVAYLILTQKQQSSSLFLEDSLYQDRHRYVDFGDSSDICHSTPVQ